MDSPVLSNGPGTFQHPSQGLTAHIENILICDILKEIFEYVVFSFAATPFTISQVCRRWRDIAFQVSALWSNISITESSINQNFLEPVAWRRKAGKCKAAFPSPFPRVQLMLERSRTQLLIISIVIPAPDVVSRWDVVHTRMLAALVKPHAPRFRAFYLDSGASWQHQALLLNVLRDCVLPNLVDLTVSRWYEAWQEFNNGFDVATYAAGRSTVPGTRVALAPGGMKEEVLCPKLLRITLMGSYQDWDRFGGRNLVQIAIAKLPLSARPTVVQLRRVLEMSSATLTSLDLTGALPYLLPEGEDVLPPVVLTNLSQLTLEYTMPVELAVFQSALLVPALKHLYILNSNREDDPDVAEANLVYTETLNSFSALLSTFPFTQLEDFALHGAQFGPPPTSSIPTNDEIVATGAKLSSLPVPFQLVQLLKNAKKVCFNNPDQFLLMGMLYSQLDMVPKDYRKENQDPGMPPIPIVLANVQELCFKVDTDDQAHRGVLRYLSNRLEKYVVEEDGERVYVGKPVDVLRLSFPLVMREQLKKEDWKGAQIARQVVVSYKFP